MVDHKWRLSQKIERNVQCPQPRGKNLFETELCKGLDSDKLQEQEQNKRIVSDVLAISQRVLDTVLCLSPPANKYHIDLSVLNMETSTAAMSSGLSRTE